MIRWRDPATAFADEHYPTLDPKKLAKGKVNPADFIFDCPRRRLCLDTETIHQNRWPNVPGARWVNYSRPSEQCTPHARRAPREDNPRSICSRRDSSSEQCTPHAPREDGTATGHDSLRLGGERKILTRSVRNTLDTPDAGREEDTVRPKTSSRSGHGIIVPLTP